MSALLDGSHWGQVVRKLPKLSTKAGKGSAFFSTLNICRTNKTDNFAGMNMQRVDNHKIFRGFQVLCFGLLLSLEGYSAAARAELKWLSDNELSDVTGQAFIRWTTTPTTITALPA